MHLLQLLRLPLLHPRLPPLQPPLVVLLQAPHLPLALLAAPAPLLPLDLDLDLVLDLLLLLTTIEAVASRYKFIDLLYLKILCLL
jgi:hypothetical protein